MIYVETVDWRCCFDEIIGWRASNPYIKQNRIKQNVQTLLRADGYVISVDNVGEFVSGVT